MGMLPRFFKQGVLGEVDRTQVGPRDGTAEGVTRNDPTTHQVAAVPQASHHELADDAPQIELADDAAPAAPRLVAPRRGSYGDSSGTRVGQPHAAAPACPPTPWNWPVTASRAGRFIWRDNWTASRSACIAQGIA
jgi:hypothetical protein